MATSAAGDKESYATLPTVKEYIPPLKQAVKRHYGSHQYFTKRAWNVIQAYITQFTKPGDTVCDPYGGSGVTVIEALVLGRKGIYLDISKWAAFLAQQVAIAPIDIGSLTDDFQRVEKACAKKIKRWQAMPDAEIEKVSLDRWYPNEAALPSNADVDTVAELFTRRQLLQLSELYHHIQRLKNDVNRELLRYAFSATLYRCNKTWISANGRKASRGGSSIFSIFRYKVAKTVTELPVWDIFDRAVTKMVEAKRETNQFIGEQPGGSSNATFLTGYAQNLGEYVSAESVDYIFTDPPYGAHIAYLDLIRMWDAWLGFDTTDRDREEEAIENGDAKHTTEHYKQKLRDAIGQMFRVLKWDRWMSIVFAHREPAFWHTIVKAAEDAGFEYVNTVRQPLTVVWSMHKKKNPLSVLAGELILNFRKVRNPKTLAIQAIGSDAVDIIKDSAELSIVHHEGATIDMIYNDLIPRLLESGLLGKVSSEIGDVAPILNETFNFDKTTGIYTVKPGRKLGCHIPMDHRIRFYLTDFLNQCERLNEPASFDSIVMNVLPKLKNGEQPTQQKILVELRKIARPTEDRQNWQRRTDPQMVFAFARDDYPMPEPVGAQPKKLESELQHNEVLFMLFSLAHAAGYKCYIGKKEQQSGWSDRKFAEMSVGSLPFLKGAHHFSKSKIEQIDLIWMDAKRPVFSFEIEHSTPITTALDRFLEMLKVAPESAEKLIVVAPKSRQRTMNSVFGSSHYIGAPMYLETKVRYLWYADVQSLMQRFTTEQPTKSTLADAVLKALHNPKAKPT